MQVHPPFFPPLRAFECTPRARRATETLEAGIERFETALANGATGVAAVGKGRALLDLGRYDEAAAAVAAVPTDYVYFLNHSVSGASNPIYSLQGNGRYSLSDMEGGNGLPFRSANDPRVPWFRDPDQPNGFDEAYPLYKIQKYNAFTTPVVLASGVEARLIEAEAALQSGDVATWLDKLNTLPSMVAAIMSAQVRATPWRTRPWTRSPIRVRPRLASICCSASVRSGSSGPPIASPTCGGSSTSTTAPRIRSIRPGPTTRAETSGTTSCSPSTSTGPTTRTSRSTCAAHRAPTGRGARFKILRPGGAYAPPGRSACCPAT